MKAFEEQVRAADGQQGRELRIIDAADWLSSDPPEADQVLEGVIDAGDKLAILAPPKLRKSFLLQQGALSFATGRGFLAWRVPKPRRVLYCQFEIREHHNHRRVKNLAKAMGIQSSDLGDRLRILNGRGLGIAGKDGLERILQAIGDFAPEVICFDPLYKVAGGVENAAEDMKVVLSAFDELAERTGAAIIYIHHDAKGPSGDRDIRDRGAGSNVLGRDYDACLTLTPHADETEVSVVEVLLRNYRPQEPFSILWDCDESGGYCFRLAADIAPKKKTSKTKQSPPVLATYLPVAEAILSDQPMDIVPFKTELKERTGLSDKRCREFVNWATAGGHSPLITHEDRGKGHHRKWIERRGQ